MSILGSGGMGRVFEAEMTGPSGFRKRIALKVLHAATGEAAEHGRADLVNEARLGALLQHPNVIDTYDLGEVEGQLYVAMEMVHGLSLRDVIKAQGALPANAVLEIGVKICAGLGHAHQLVVAGRRADFVHRDVKPGNILLGQHGQLKITDFGISRAREVVERHTQTGTLRGSPAYMSPEQVNGIELDSRSDLFSLGLMLFEMLTNTRVFSARNLAQLTLQILDVDYQLKKTGVLALAAQKLPGIETVLARCLRANRDERYDTCEELSAALVELARGVSLNRYVAGVVRAQLEGEVDGITEEVPREQLDDVPAEASLAAPLPSSDAPTTTVRIPAENDSFVGREDELKLLQQQLSGSRRMVTVRGMAGVGKSRLVLRYVLDLMGDADGGSGVTYVGCADFESLADLNQGLFEALDMKCPEGMSEEGQSSTLARCFSSLGDHILVIDQFDQMVNFAEQAVSALLDGASGLRIVATSRERLWLDVEHVLELEPLHTADGVSLLQERIGKEPLKTTSPKLLERIAMHLDGNPLAIELVAAQVVEQGLDMVEQHLGAWVEHSEIQTDTGAEGKSILDEALEWSWSRLEAWERDALAQCSVFRGGFFLDAAAAVVDLSEHPSAPWLMEVVVSLNNKSLLRRDELDGCVRFEIYESIRLFSAGKLEAAEGAHAKPKMSTAAGRHARHYGSLGVDSILERLEFVGGQTMVRRLCADARNLQVALVNAMEFGAADDAAGAFVGLVESIGEGGFAPGQLDSNIERLRAMEGMTPGWRARVLASVAVLWRRTARSGDALEGLHEAVGIVQEIGDRKQEARLLAQLAKILWIRHDLDEAERFFEASLSVSREIDFEVGVCRALCCLGTIYKTRGLLTRAEEYLREMLRMVDVLGMERERCTGENNLGLLYLNQGRLGLAEKFLLSAAAGHRRLGRRQAEAVTQLNLGLLHLRMENHTVTREYYDTALESFRAQGDLWGEGITSANIGMLLVVQGEFEQAETVLCAGIKCHELVPNIQGVAYMKGLLARAFLGQQRLDEASEKVAEAEAIYEQIEDPRYYARLLCVRADVCLAQGEISDARGAYVQARALAMPLQVNAEFGLGRALSEVKERLDAVSSDRE
ncbi:MAG: protein kinase [Myxococcota bacterium]|nr:protein kinase [Myxococcota bacterium]